MDSLKKSLLTVAGLLALLLGIVGVILPGLPTTPFVLLAAYCFARASPALHERLRQNRFFGRALRDWEREPALTIKTKLLASMTMLLMVLISAWQLADQSWLPWSVLGLGLIGTAVVWRIPTRGKGL